MAAEKSELTTAELARLSEGKEIVIGKGENIALISADDLSCSLAEMVNDGTVAEVIGRPDHLVAYAYSYPEG